MLVLVTQLIESWFGKLKHKLESVIAVMLLSVTTFCFAQTDSTGFETDSQPSKSEKSVLVLVEGRSSETDLLDQKSVDSDLPKPGANGSASIDTHASANATFTKQTLSPAPQPPQDLLMPADPSESTFTQPWANELRGESESSKPNSTPSEDKSDEETSANDDSDPLGTFASTNQSFQNQQSNPGSQFAAPDQGRDRFNGALSNPRQIGQSDSTGLMQFNSGANFSSQSPALPGSDANNSSQATFQPSQRELQSSTSGQARSFQTGGAPLPSSVPVIRSINTRENSSGREQQPIQSSNPYPNSYNAQAYGQLNDRDNNVRSTGFTQPATGPELSTKLAKTLIARYSTDNVSADLPGQSTKLIEMLRQPISSQQRREMVRQYWETYYDWANYISSKRFEQWLTRIPANVGPSEKAILEAAIAVAGNKTLAAEIQLGKSQSGLLQFMPNRSSTDFLPLPNDLPLIQKYKTNYELYRSRRMMPVSLRGIDRMLPKTLELIILRAEAVKATKTAADQVLAAMSTGQSIMSVLESGRIWRAAERDLVASVVSYNQAIADYSLSVTGGYQSPEEVVAMLIAKPQVAVAQAPSVIQRQPGRFNSNAQGTDRFGRPSSQRNQSGSSILERAAGSRGQTPQGSNPGTNGTNNFNLGATGAFQSNPDGSLDGRSVGSNNRSVAAPSVAPFGDRPAANTNNGFGPSVPRQ